MKPHLKSILLSPLVILPSVLIGIYLSGNIMPVQYGYYVVCSILLLAIFDFATVVFIEQYRNRGYPDVYPHGIPQSVF